MLMNRNKYKHTHCITVEQVKLTISEFKKIQNNNQIETKKDYVIL